jgi:hypothetical protein
MPRGDFCSRRIITSNEIMGREAAGEKREVFDREALPNIDTWDLEGLGWRRDRTVSNPEQLNFEQSLDSEISVALNSAARARLLILPCRSGC